MTGKTKKTVNSSKDEKKMVSVKFEQITDSDLKLKYVSESIFSHISNEEILNSDVWAMIVNETGEVRSLITIWNDSCEENIIITHMHCIDTWLKQDAFMNFYLYIEEYYVNNGVKSLKIFIPKIKGMTNIIKFFKNAGFKKIAFVQGYLYIISENIVANTKGPTTFLFKADLEKWYEKVDGKYHPLIMKGEGVYKPIKGETI